MHNGYLDKVLSVTDGKERRTFTYHADGQLATATRTGGPRSVAAKTGSAASPLAAETETFLWDGLALIRRGSTAYVNEPHPGGGAAVASSRDGIMFNDILGTTLGTEGAEGYAPVEMTAFGDRGAASGAAGALFTGKPEVEGLGYAFLFRNYRAGLGKWQTADPLGYPDGWNQMAYCGNECIRSIDLFGGITIVNTDNKRNDTEVLDSGDIVLYYGYDYLGRLVEHHMAWEVLQEYDIYDVYATEDPLLNQMLENAALVGAYEAAATAALGGLLYIAAGVSAMFGAVPITATCLFAGNACLVASTGNTVLSGTSIALTIAIDSLDKTNYKFPDDFQIIGTQKEKVGDSITNIWFYDIILE